MDRLRFALAASALLIPAVLLALNGHISYRERALVEPYDIPAAIAFVIAAVLAWRGLTAALIGGAALCAIFLATVVTSGPPVFIAYWVVALILTLQALPVLRRP